MAEEASVYIQKVITPEDEARALRWALRQPRFVRLTRGQVRFAERQFEEGERRRLAGASANGQR